MKPTEDGIRSWKKFQRFVGFMATLLVAFPRCYRSPLYFLPKKAILSSLKLKKMSSLFPRNKVVSDGGKSKKAKPELKKTKDVSTPEEGLFGTAAKKKRNDGNADKSSGSNKRARPVGDDGLIEKEEDIDNVGELVRMVKSLSGKGKVPRITPPTFQGLAQGTLMYGIVKIVTRRQIFVALPFGLNGLVSSSDVSDFQLFKDSNSASQILEKDDDENSEDEEEEEDNDEAAVKSSSQKDESGKKSGSTLESMFKVGQTVKCVVLKTSETKSGRRSVQLSLKPSVVNRGLFLEHLGAGSGIYGAVSSVEVKWLGLASLSKMCSCVCIYNMLV
jgi:hypothetical protein